MKKIAVGDLGEFWYGDYKEPFVQLEGAVPGYPQGVVLKADDGKLLCSQCGKTFDNLVGHVRSHGLTATSYKRESGLLQKSALVSERLRQVRIGHALRRRAFGFRPPAASRGKGVRPHDRYTEMTGRKNGAWTVERLNMTGRCYEQVLAVARTIAGSGRAVTFAAMGRHGIHAKTIDAYSSGGIVELRAKVASPRPQRSRYRWREEDLLSALRSAALTLGRTPATSDLRRLGLPSSSTYVKHFGSYTKACRRAGLDPNVPLNGDDLAILFLSAYSVSGEVGKASQQIHVAPERGRQVLARYGFPFHGNRWNGVERKSWAADMARRLAGWPDAETAA